jgi:TPR repeat protein
MGCQIETAKRDGVVVEKAGGGNTKAMYNVGVMYSCGKSGFNRDETRALSWYRKSMKVDLYQDERPLDTMYAKVLVEPQNAMGKM